MAVAGGRDGDELAELAEVVLPALDSFIGNLSTAAQELTTKAERDNLFGFVGPVFADNKQVQAKVLATDGDGVPVTVRVRAASLPLMPHTDKVKDQPDALPFLPSEAFPLRMDQVQWKDWKRRRAQPVSQRHECDISFVSLYRKQADLGSPVAISVYVANVKGLKGKQPEDNYNIEIFFLCES